MLVFVLLYPIDLPSEGVVPNAVFKNFSNNIDTPLTPGRPANGDGGGFLMIARAMFFKDLHTISHNSKPLISDQQNIIHT